MRLFSILAREIEPSEKGLVKWYRIEKADALTEFYYDQSINTGVLAQKLLEIELVGMAAQAKIQGVTDEKFDS